MLEYATSAHEKIKGRSVGDLESDPDLRDVIARRLEILGEAAHRVSRELKGAHPGWCAVSDSPENECDCALSQLVEMVWG